MSEAFVCLLKQLFPTIEEGTRDQLVKFVKQFQSNPKLYYSSLTNISAPYQGDIISDLPFLMINEKGKIEQGILNGMIISHSCSIENKNSILIAPVYDLAFFKDECSPTEQVIDFLKENVIYDKFYLPPFSDTRDFIADLNGVTSLDRGFLTSKIEDKSSQIIARLSQTGYYYFVCKLTVHFLRREPSETKRDGL